MASTDTKEGWSQFQSDMRSLAGELRRHYENRADDRSSAEINRSLQELGRAADSFFASLDTASRDPEVRTRTKQAARSFSSALRDTVREVGEELDKAFHQPSKKE